MQKKLIIVYSVLMLITISISTLLIGQRVQQVYIESEEKQMDAVAAFFMTHSGSSENHNLLHDFESFSQTMDIRVTIISAEEANLGAVLMDSKADPATMQNHMYREEVKEALAGGEGYSVRTSATTKTTYIYKTYPGFVLDGQNTVVRLALPLHEINRFFMQILPISVLLLVAFFIIGSILFSRLSRTVLFPLNDLSKRIHTMQKNGTIVPLPSYKDEQINVLSDSFNHLLIRLNDNVRQLRRNNSELEAVFDNVNDALIVMDSRLKVRMFNQVALQLFDVTNDALFERPFYESVRHPHLIESLQDVSQTSVKASMEIHWRGDKIYQVQISPLRMDFEEGIDGILLVAGDITDMRSVENMRKEFVANVSHELKTPLTTIRGFVETLLNDDLDDPVIIRKFLGIIDGEADRLQRMIFQLLYLSKLDNKLPLQDQVDIHLNAFCDRMRLTLSEQLQEGVPITLSFSVEPNNLMYRGSEDLLTQIILNLVSNAIKYSQGTEVHTSFQVENDQLVMRVRDDGIGIAKADQKRIFERFYRIEKSRAQKKGGTGLGLSIVKHLVKNAGGHIALISDAGEGSEFIVHLPYTQK